MGRRRPRESSRGFFYPPRLATPDYCESERPTDLSAALREYNEISCNRSDTGAPINSSVRLLTAIVSAKSSGKDRDHRGQRIIGHLRAGVQQSSTGSQKNDQKNK